VCAGQGSLGPLEAILGKSAVHPPIPVKFRMPADGFATLVIEDANGRRVRNLLSEVPFKAGEQTVYWDGVDESGGMQEEADGIWRTQGALVEPGNYQVRGMFHRGIDLRYEFSVYTEGKPPWQGHGASGRWLADHTPPSAVMALPDNEILIASFVAEAGDGLVWTNPEGKKLRALRWLGGHWTGASHLARDTGKNRADDLYAAATWPIGNNQNEEEAELRITAIRKDGQERKVLIHPFSRAGLPKVAMRQNNDLDKRYIAGLAAHDGLLVASMDRQQQLLFIDARAGKVVASATLANVRGVAFDAAGRLLVLVGHELQRFTLPAELPDPLVLPAPQIIVNSLEDPQQLALSPNDEIFLSDWGASHQIKVFSAEGKPLRTIGTAGAPKAGPYDETHMNHPYGLTVTGDGHLWVAEHDYLPKRVSVWTTEGKFVRGLYGPSQYGGGGNIDPLDKSRFYYVDEKETGAMEFKLDWEAGTSRLSQVYFRPAADEPLQLPGSGPQMPLYVGGRQYMTNLFNITPVSGSAVVGIWLMEKGLVRPVAAMGDASSWPLLRGDSFKSRLPAGVDLAKFNPDRSPVFFAWADLNDDQAAQPEEVTTVLVTPHASLPAQGDFRVGEIFLTRELAATTTGGNVLKSKGFSKSGVPLYDAAQLSSPAFVAATNWSSGARLAIPGSDGRFLLTGGPLRGFVDGQLRWTYPNPWPSLHSGHEAPPQQYPGMLLATTRVLGQPVKVAGSDIGEVWVYNGDAGNHYLMSMDGLFIAQLFQNGNKADLPQWDSLPVERGICLNEVAKHGEDFWPTFTATADNQFYLVTGKEHSSIVRLDGLAAIRRIPPAALTVTPTQRAAASNYALLRDAVRQQRQGKAVLQVVLGGAVPKVDGVLDEWAKADWATLDESAQAAVAITGDHLFAAFRTTRRGLLANTCESLPMLFKTGGALDLMLATNQAADPKRVAPAAGDLRLLITRHADKPMAALYRPVAAGEKAAPFSSPWRTVTFDRVDDVSAQVALAQGVRKGTFGTKRDEREIFEFEVSIPLAVLGLNPKAGQTIAADIGVLRGSDGQTRQRLYWHNKTTGLVNDIPGEAMLTPSLWGRWEMK